MPDDDPVYTVEDTLRLLFGPNVDVASVRTEIVADRVHVNIKEPTVSEHETSSITVTPNLDGVEIESCHEAVFVAWDALPGLIADLGNAIAAKMTQTFSEATQIAARRLNEAGIPTVGVDAQGHIVSRSPDGSKTFIGLAQTRIEDHLDTILSDREMLRQTLAPRDPGELLAAVVNLLNGYQTATGSSVPEVRQVVLDAVAAWPLTDEQ